MDKTQYKDVYVFAEQREGVIQNVAFELLGKARELADRLNQKVVAILAGSGIKEKAKELIAYGADSVLCVDAPELKQYITEPYDHRTGFGTSFVCPSGDRIDGRLYGFGYIGRRRFVDDPSGIRG